MPSILDNQDELIRAELDKLDQESGQQLQVDFTAKEFEVEFQRSWANGWGVAAWARTKWAKFKNMDAGARVTKRW